VGKYAKDGAKMQWISSSAMVIKRCAGKKGLVHLAFLNFLLQQ
jgi:hypothetical protein